MVQTLKTEVRERILAAAERVFAETGYSGATMANIAAEARISTGNTYRYFADKDALFDAVITDEFARTFLLLLRRRVRALVRADDLTALDPAALRDAEELLRFWVVHRRKVITILDRAAGSRHEAFGAQFVDELVRLTLARLKIDAPGRRVGPAARLVLDHVFRNTVRMIVAILEAYETEEEIRHAFQGFWTYQLAGLAAFSKWVSS